MKRKVKKKVKVWVYYFCVYKYNKKATKKKLSVMYHRVQRKNVVTCV